jgi:hypothetical protein
MLTKGITSKNRFVPIFSRSTAEKLNEAATFVPGVKHRPATRWISQR